ncbi:hypothetical protein C8R43DRAFT_1138722 [Mycena crocata]|nr:hypothetical protein C8R43DRAFT_1138722 [Mycena crocata]
MFFAASIALASLLAVSKITVNSAPVTLRNVAVQQACTLPSGGGIWIPLIGSNCTNTPGLRSLVLNLDADCAVFPLPDCEFIGSDRPIHKSFSDDSQNLDADFQSVQCFNNVGTVNGFTAGTPQDLAPEERDKAAGVFVGRK